MFLIPIVPLRKKSTHEKKSASCTRVQKGTEGAISPEGQMEQQGESAAGCLHRDRRTWISSRRSHLQTRRA